MDHVQIAAFETSKRLLANLVNEEIVPSRVMLDDSDASGWLRLREALPTTTIKQTRQALVALSSSKASDLSTSMSRNRAWHPEDFEPAVFLVESFDRKTSSTATLNPREIFEFLCGRYAVSHKYGEIISGELQSSADNQARWFLEAKSTLPQLDSPMIEWEAVLVRGNPIHPMHRSCLAQPPLHPIKPEDLGAIRRPEIILVSVEDTDVQTVGPFEEDFEPLLAKVNAAPVPAGKAIVPALRLQFPAIQHYFPSAQQHPSDRIFGTAQASTRSISLDASLGFPFHIKLPMGAKISSSLRTIQPWKANIVSEMSQLMHQLLPSSIWLFEEPSVITGNPKNVGAEHLACILRRDIESTARARRQALILGAAFGEKDINSNVTHAERIFNLRTEKSKLDWLRRYAALLMEATLPPLLQHGIQLEAHGQNMLARVDMDTGELMGFAARDMGNIRIHGPTMLANSGLLLESAAPGNPAISTPLETLWGNAHHCVFQNHLFEIVQGLGLGHRGGWAVIREELEKTLSPDDDQGAAELYRFMLKAKLPLKCYMRQKMEGLKAGERLYRDVPNVLLG